MKKIFYILASAIVALGAMSCQNEIDENSAPESTNDCTITVNIADTRVTIGEPKNGEVAFTPEEGDILSVQFKIGDSWSTSNICTFVCQEDLKTFKTEDVTTFTNCMKNSETSGIQFILSGVEIAGAIDSSKGKDGIGFTANYDEAATKEFIAATQKSITVECLAAILKYSSTETVTLNSDLAIFVTDSDFSTTLTLPSTEGQVSYIAVAPYEAALSYYLGEAVEGDPVKSIPAKVWTKNTVYNLGTLAPVAYFNVTNNAGWDKTYLYAWVGTGVNEKKILGEWPGTEMKNGRVVIPNEYIGKDINFIIHNNSGIQTRDLSTKFVSGYTHTIGDPDTNNITIYLNNNWNVQDLKIHSWEPVLWAGQTWDNRKAPDGVTTTDWGTFSYRNIDAKQIAEDKTGNLLVTGTGKQTADLLNVDYSKDVYLQFTWKNNRDQLEIMTTPY